MDEQQGHGSFKCGKCGASFETREELEAHERSAHRAEQEGMESGSDKGMQSDVEGVESGGQMTS